MTTTHIPTKPITVLGVRCRRCSAQRGELCTVVIGPTRGRPRRTAHPSRAEFAAWLEQHRRAQLKARETNVSTDLE